MKRVYVRLCALLLLCTVLSGCTFVDSALSAILPEVTEIADLPKRMVQHIDISITPDDPAYVRHYQTQTNLTAVLQMLRDLATQDIPEEAPALGSAFSYCTIVATYANGDQQVYVLLNEQYLKVGEEEWCHISPELAADFMEYLRSHQSDDGSYVPPATEPPAETTAPAESTVPSGTDA